MNEVVDESPLKELDLQKKNRWDEAQGARKLRRVTRAVAAYW